MLDPTLRQLTQSVTEYEATIGNMHQRLEELQGQFDAYKEKHPSTEEELAEEQENEAKQIRVSDVLPEGMTDVEIVPLDQGPQRTSSGGYRTPYPWEKTA